MRKVYVLMAAVLLVAGCTDTATRHPDYEDCWVIQDGDNDRYVATACKVDLDIETER